MPVPFQLPKLYPIIDTASCSDRELSPMLLGEALLDAGVRILQYRHKDPWTAGNFEEAKKLGSLCGESGVLFVLNDRADYARLLGAALHVGQDDLPPLAARKVIGDEVMGFSTHNRQQLLRGHEEPVEYLALGPIFATQSKSRPDPVLGVECLRKLRPLTHKPLAAIGGINMGNAQEVLGAGASSVAVISGLMPERCNKRAVKQCIQEWMQLLS
ncbi:MAG: thiamine phosphate synthase [Acidobacteriaceae bacterium]|nr:thiamine phosphate synthase [Acidobacteriaceae bacterium]